MNEKEARDFVQSWKRGEVSEHEFIDALASDENHELSSEFLAQSVLDMMRDTAESVMDRVRGAA